MMHRQILCAKKNQIIDHIDGNGFNNQRKNLRFCLPSDNSRNIHAKRGAQPYHGIYWDKRYSKWDVRIKVNNKSIFIGSFKLAIDAALARDYAAVKYHGEFAFLNFPHIMAVP